MSIRDRDGQNREDRGKGQRDQKDNKENDTTGRSRTTQAPPHLTMMCFVSFPFCATCVKHKTLQRFLRVTGVNHVVKCHATSLVIQPTKSHVGLHIPLATVWIAQVLPLQICVGQHTQKAPNEAENGGKGRKTQKTTGVSKSIRRPERSTGGAAKQSDHREVLSEGTNTTGRLRRRQREREREAREQSREQHRRH